MGANICEAAAACRSQKRLVHRSMRQLLRDWEEESADGVGFFATVPQLTAYNGHSVHVCISPRWPNEHAFSQTMQGFTINYVRSHATDQTRVVNPAPLSCKSVVTHYCQQGAAKHTFPPYVCSPVFGSKGSSEVRNSPPLFIGSEEGRGWREGGGKAMDPYWLNDSEGGVNASLMWLLWI